MKVLAGDIGGTNARLAVYEVELAHHGELAAETFPSRQYSSLADIVAGFMKAHGLECQRACFGVPGPVVGGRAQTTNLPWLVDASKLATAAGVEAVALINDLQAQAFGIAALAHEDFVVLNPGSSAAAGNSALISAGTGLGQAGLYWDGRAHHPFACEGGHASFAPRGELQIALLEYLARRYGHVSWERLVSGPGLANIYDFLLEYRGSESPVWFAEETQATGDAAPVITRAALEGRSELCVETLDLFVEFFGAEAGNLALKIMATGGLYVGGGIAPRIVDWLKRGLFMEAFVAKGRMRSLLEAIPVRVIINKSTALLGAARYAVTLGAES
ncbi:MAG: glucokinase [Gemmatimonadota bacterium]|nr:MAG: glucokinase [Gemmatimonadota bacterium]